MLVLLAAVTPAAAGDDLGLNQLRGSRVVPDRLDGIVTDQPGPGPRAPVGSAPLRDRNADALLSRQEFQRAYPARPWLFRIFDSNQDGQISPAEMARGRPLLDNDGQ